MDENQEHPQGPITGAEQAPDVELTTETSTATTTTLPEASIEPEPGAPRVGLQRSSSRRIVAGVAGGIGDRFDIDANIVRVVFVVSCVFWGLGAAIYLAMWALIPLAPNVPGEAPEPVEQKSASSSHWLRYALLAGFVTVAVIFISTAGGAPQLGNGLAATWLIFLIVLAVITLRTPARRLNVQRLFALLFLVALSVVILVSGVFLAVLASTGVPIEGGDGVRTAQPTTIAQVQHQYRTGFGTETLDLSHVDFPRAGYSLTASVAVGYLLIELPANVVVDVKTHVGIGRVQYPYRDGWSAPPFASVPRSMTTAASQQAAPHLTIDAQVGFGVIGFVRAR